MIPLMSLWLPILLSAVIIFFASWIVHAMLPYHKGDYAKLSGEDAILDAMRKAGTNPGDYMFPYSTPKEMSSPAMMEKFKTGPAGFVTLIPPGPPTMGASLIQWFIYLIAVGVLVAYLTSRTLDPGDPYLEVFRVAGTVAFLAYAGAHPAASIWYRRKWGTTTKFLFDGFVYGLLTGGVFGWLWP